MTGKAASPFVAVWQGMTVLAERVLAVEKAGAIKIGAARRIEAPAAFKVRDLTIGSETFLVLVPGDDGGESDG